MLIVLHKVRGRPTFDIANRIGDTDLIVTTTYGHRVYPIWVGELTPNMELPNVEDETSTELWDSLRDHFHQSKNVNRVSRVAKKTKASGTSLTLDDLKKGLF